MKRKVISLQTVAVNTNDSDAPGGSYWEIRNVALCDDGTMWRTSSDYHTEWSQIENVPQPKP